MRRGLMVWDREEIPLEILEQRLKRLQTAMAAAGEDGLILYTNFIRSSAVSYITAFSPYWADGVLLIPRRGEPVFATTLSNRVAPWVATVKPVGELVHSPTPGVVLGQRLAVDASVRRVAVLELDAFPGGLYDELASALPNVEIVDGSPTFGAARGVLDAVERTLLLKTHAIAESALDALNSEAISSVGRAVGAVEMHARLQGAEEAYIAVAPDLDADRRFVRLSGDRSLGQRFAIRATIAYKGTWVRRTRTYSREQGDVFAIRRADAWFSDLLASIQADHALLPQIRAAVANLPGAVLQDWLAEATIGTRPLAVVASAQSPDRAGERTSPALILTLCLTINGAPWCGAALVGLKP